MGRRERNKEDKQRRLEAAGLAAFLEDGFTGASVERIAEAADVARGTFTCTSGTRTRCSPR